MKSFKRPSREIEIKIAGSKASEDAISFSSSEATYFDSYKEEALKATQEETVEYSSHNIWVDRYLVPTVEMFPDIHLSRATRTSNEHTIRFK